MALTTDELRKIARRNLEKEDAIISSVNAVNRMRSSPQEGFARVAQYQEPGTEARTGYVNLRQGGFKAQYAGIDHNEGTQWNMDSPYDSVSVARSVVSPQENIGIANAMESADRGNRFGFGSPQYQQGTDEPVVPQQEETGLDFEAIAQRRSQILKGIDPDNPGLYPGNVRSKRGGPSRREVLDNEADTALHILRDEGFASAKRATARLTAQRDLEITTQTKNAMTRLAQIPVDGTPESAAKVAAVKDDYLGAFLNSKALRDEFRSHAATHDKIEAERRKGVETEAAIAATEAALPKKHATIDLAKYALTPEQFQHHTNPRATSASDDDVGDIKAIESKRSDTGKNVAIDVPGRSTPILMGRQRYEKLTAIFPRADTPAQPVAQTQPAGATATQTAAPPEGIPATTEVKPLGGHRYLIDHATKKVLRQID